MTAHTTRSPRVVPRRFDVTFETRPSRRRYSCIGTDDVFAAVRMAYRRLISDVVGGTVLPADMRHGSVDDWQTGTTTRFVLSAFVDVNFSMSIPAATFKSHPIPLLVEEKGDVGRDPRLIKSRAEGPRPSERTSRRGGVRRQPERDADSGSPDALTRAVDRAAWSYERGIVQGWVGYRFAPIPEDGGYLRVPLRTGTTVLP